MFNSRSNPSSSSSAHTHQTITETSAKIQEYEVYLLADNQPATIAAAHLNIKGGSAVLLYPTDDSSSSNGSTKWQACFIDQGTQTVGHIVVGEFVINAAIPSQESFIVLQANTLNANLTQQIEQAIVLHQASVKQSMRKMTAASNLTTPHQTKAQELPGLLIKDLDDIVLGYVDGDSDTTGYVVGRANALFDKKIPASALLRHVIRGEQAQAEAMIKKNPRLLLEIGRVTDYSGRTIEGTAFQLALGAEDVATQEGEECMAEMIQRYLLTLPRGEEIMAEQYQAQFPKDWEETEKTRAKNDLAALEKVFKAISDAMPINNSYETCEAACESALVEFRDYLESQAKTDIIKTGKHFNVQLLAEAFKLYNDNYTAFGNSWNSPKNMLSWRKVCGFVQRFLPTCYAQAFSQGIYHITEEKAPLKRSLEFRHDPGYRFYPLAVAPSRLGYDYTAFVGGRARAGKSPVGGWADAVGFFTNLMSNKNIKLAELMQPAESQPKSRCVIC